MVAIKIAKVGAVTSNNGVITQRIIDGNGNPVDIVVKWDVMEDMIKGIASRMREAEQGR